MRIEAIRIDPYTEEPDPHGIPQIACPACGRQVNPQFTCLRCPCAAGLQTHEAVDDRGSPFHLVDAVECSHQGGDSRLPAEVREFPTLLTGVVEGASPRVEPGVVCPLLAWPEQVAPLALEIDGERWVPVGNCRSCQFFRGIEKDAEERTQEGREPVFVVCSAPPAPPLPPEGARQDPSADARESA
ncbi:MAG: hypothetical protein ACM3US_14460 [Sphingomonadaceae bacterium]